MGYDEEDGCIWGQRIRLAELLVRARFLLPMFITVHDTINPAYAGVQSRN